MRHGDHHVLALDQIFIFQLGTTVQDFCSPRRGKQLMRFLQLFLDECHDPQAGTQNPKVLLDLLTHLVQSLGNFFLSNPGQPLKPQLKNGARLFLR